MSTYRVFFRNASGIVGRQDFVADDDDAAVVVADILCNACSDCCTSFEVWDGGCRIVAPRTPRSLVGRDAIVEKRQAVIVECEEAIQQSNWSIASSERLLHRLAELRAQSPYADDGATEPA